MLGVSNAFMLVLFMQELQEEVNLRDLKTFVCIAEAGSIALAGSADGDQRRG